MLMRLPASAASWHISYHSGCKDSVEKYIPRFPPKTLAQRRNKPLLPYQLIPYRTSTPSTSLPTYGTQWVSSSPLIPPCDEALHLEVCVRGGGGGWRGGEAGATEPDMDTGLVERGTHRGSEGHTQPEGLAREERGSHHGGRDSNWAGEISWGYCYIQAPRCSHRQERTRNERGQEKEEPEDIGTEEGERDARLGCIVSSDLSEGHRHDAGF